MTIAFPILIFIVSRDSGHPRRTGEMPHPFTTCSSHDVSNQNARGALALDIKHVSLVHTDMPVDTLDYFQALNKPNRYFPVRT